MLLSVKALKGYNIRAQDGEIGKISDVLFDDHSWALRYLVLDEGGWLPRRKILVPQQFLGRPDWREGDFSVELTKKQIEDGPPLAENEPVSRQKEKALHDYFGIEAYWIRLPGGSYPIAVPPSTSRATRGEAEGQQDVATHEYDPHLRSCEEVMGYHVQASDQGIGHIEDLIVEDQSWLLRYVVVNTRNWLPGRSVLVAVSWLTEISWDDEKVFVDLTKEQIEKAPRYEPSEPVNRKQEEVLYDYYGRPSYWS